MGLIDGVSPRALLDLYVLLSKESRNAFLKLLAATLTAEDLAAAIAAAPMLERERLAAAQREGIRGILQPIMSREAARLFRAFPGLSEDDFADEIDKAVTHTMTGYTETIIKSEQEALKKKRDRKSDESTILRNVEICDSWAKGAGGLTQGQIAKKYDLTPSDIRKIVKAEAKWRTLKLQLES